METHSVIGLPLVERHYGLSDYRDTLLAMRRFTEQRSNETDDEIWLLEHPPVFTLGQAAKLSHIIDAGNIAVVNSDRGGEVTYHGPGQIILYTLLDLKRRRMTVKGLVYTLEQVVINLLQNYWGIDSFRRDNAPGVYVPAGKIAALGLRVRRQGCYHGLSLNVNMNLEPFTRINPCGYKNLSVTDLRQLGIREKVSLVAPKLVTELKRSLR